MGWGDGQSIIKHAKRGTTGLKFEVKVYFFISGEGEEVAGIRHCSSHILQNRDWCLPQFPMKSSLNLIVICTNLSKQDQSVTPLNDATFAAY